MAGQQSNQSAESHNRDDAVAVVRALRDAGHTAYFAGGCVRDTLLGLVPKDYDIATDSPPDRVRKLFRNTQAVGAAFGVILVRHGKSVIEVATFRTDGAYLDGRRPESVVFATAEEDAKRRDFTINGLFMDPLDGDKVIDYVGGQADLKTKTLRAIGDPDLRFEEDHLRLLRAIRFAARFDLSIHADTAGAIARHAEHLKRISPERIAQELRLMLVPQTRDVAYRLLSPQLLDVVLMRFLPERRPVHPHAPSGLISALGPPLHHGDISFGLALAAITLWERFRDTQSLLTLLSPAEVRRSCSAARKALKISNEEFDVMAGTLAFGPLLQAAPPTVATMKRFLAMPTAAEAMHLMATLARVLPDLTERERIEGVLAQLRVLMQSEYAPAAFITGDDLTALGWSPGPLFKKVLDAVYDAQLEGGITDQPAALDLANKLRESAMHP